MAGVVLFIVSHPPYGTERAHNAARMAGAAVTKEADVRVFRMGDAVGCGIRHRSRRTQRSEEGDRNGPDVASMGRTGAWDPFRLPAESGINLLSHLVSGLAAHPWKTIQYANLGSSSIRPAGRSGW